jgi:hypothetical protein
MLECLELLWAEIKSTRPEETMSNLTRLEKLEKVFKAADDVVKMWARGKPYDPPEFLCAPECSALESAVLSAEQPAWSAGPPSSPTTSIYLRTASSHCAVGWMSDWGLASRIARLLNEDDAKKS